MNDRNLLDAAAKIVRDRITPESYLYPQVGDIPPQPPTLRGRLGAVLVNLVRRMLFWYTGPFTASSPKPLASRLDPCRS